MCNSATVKIWLNGALAIDAKIYPPAAECASVVNRLSYRFMAKLYLHHVLNRCFGKVTSLKMMLLIDIVSDCESEGRTFESFRTRVDW